MNAVGICRRGASKTAVEREGGLLEGLAGEGEQYYGVSANTDLYLNNSASWYLWEELSIADGGTQWA